MKKFFNITLIFVPFYLIAQEIIDVKVQEVAPSNQQKVVQKIGTSEAPAPKTLFSPASGIISEILVQEQEIVYQGQELLKIQNPSLEFELEKQKLLLEQAQKKYQSHFTTSSDKKWTPKEEKQITQILREVKWKEFPNWKKEGLEFQNILEKYKQTTLELEIANTDYNLEKKEQSQKTSNQKSLISLQQINLEIQILKEELTASLEKKEKRKVLDTTEDIFSQTEELEKRITNIKKQLALAESKLKLAKKEHQEMLQKQIVLVSQKRKKILVQQSKNLQAKREIIQYFIQKEQEKEQDYYLYKQAKLSYEQSQSKKKNFTLVSPFTGKIQKNYVTANQSVKEGSNLLEISKQDKIKVFTYVRTQESTLFRENDGVELVFDSYKDKTFQGFISKIIADPQRKNSFRVEIEVSNEQNLLRAGMVAKITYIAQQLKNEIFVPLHSVIEKEGKKVVYVFKDNVAEEVLVETGNIIGENILIKKGLIAGDKLIVHGQQFLSAGSRIRIQNSP